MTMKQVEFLLREKPTAFLRPGMTMKQVEFLLREEPASFAFGHEMAAEVFFYPNAGVTICYSSNGLVKSIHESEREPKPRRKGSREGEGGN